MERLQTAMDSYKQKCLIPNTTEDPAGLLIKNSLINNWHVTEVILTSDLRTFSNIEGCLSRICNKFSLQVLADIYYLSTSIVKSIIDLPNKSSLLTHYWNQ